MDKVITIEEPDVELKNFLEMEAGPYKNFLYQNNMMGKQFRRVNISYKGDTMYYSYTQIVVKRNGFAYYTKQGEKAGFTFENRKLKIWWGKTVQSIPYLPLVLKHLGMEWFEYKMYKYLTKGLFEKMLRGDITNPMDYCKAYLKAVRMKNVSPKLFYDAIRSEHVNKFDIFSAVEVAKDPNHYLERVPIKYNGGENYIFNVMTQDLVKQAIILGRKIDFLWSEKRMKAEHDAWTKEIMDMEGENIDDTPLTNLRKFELMDGMTLLDSQKKVWMEGKLMNHCIYTNYWYSIKNGTYNAYHIEVDDEIATLGVNIFEDGKIHFNQMYGHRNSAVSDTLKARIMNWMALINNKKQLTAL